MSIFSGKCDFADHVSDKDDDYFVNSIFFIYANGREHKLDIKNQFDAIKYYPYIVGSGGFEKGRCTIYLSSESFIDTEETERLQWCLNDMLKYWRKCKRNKVSFVAEEALKRNTFGMLQDYEKQIADRVEKYGDKVDLKDIHTYIHEYYRKEWYKYMVQSGYESHKAFCWVYKELFTTDERIQQRLDKCKY